MIGRRGLGYEYENVPTPLIKRFVKEEKRKGFKELSNWKQWSSIKNAVVAAIKKHTRKKVKSLVPWQHYRKQLLVTG